MNGQKVKQALAYGMAGLYFLLVAYWINALWGKWVYDDPFITYRYTSNLLRGIGFVYNPGERVLSTTTPFLALLLAALSPLSGNLPRVANLIGAVSIAAGGLLVFDIARSLKSPIVGWVGLLLYPSFSLLLNSIGSETPLYITFALASFAFYYRRNFILTAVFCALTVIIRPDGFLVPMVIGLDYLGRTQDIRRWSDLPAKSRLAILLFVVLTVPWFLFAWAYFGSPIPATLAAKQHQGMMDISRGFPLGLLWTFKQHLSSWHYWLQIGLAFVGSLHLFFAVLSTKKASSLCCARTWALFLAWPLSYFLAYSLLGLTSYFWYYAPLIPGLIVLIGLGISAIHTFTRRGSQSEKIASLITAAIIIVLALPQGINMVEAAGDPNPRSMIYRKAGLWLNKNTPLDAKVGTLEVGIIGYYSERPMVDFAGLIQPDVAKYLNHDTTYEDAALYSIQMFQPDYLVLFEGSFSRLEQDYIKDHCTIATLLQGDRFGYDTNLIIYRCDQQETP